MRKRKIGKLLILSMLSITILASTVTSVYADSSKVVTIGANLSDEQREKMFEYFGVDEAEVEVIEVNNQEEREYLEGVATEGQIGRRTYSCAYIKPTNTGKVQVRTANLNWVTCEMISTTLITAGITSCDVVAAAPIEVSGTGALTGIMKAYETVTGEELSQEKKEIATEELIVTADLAEDIGQNQATVIINNVKLEVIKENITDEQEIENIIKDTAKDYDVELNDEQVGSIRKLATKISNQNYNYDEIKNTLDSLSNKLSESLGVLKNKIEQNKGFFEKIGDFFGSIWNWVKGLFSTAENENIDITTAIDITEDYGEDSILNDVNDDVFTKNTEEENSAGFNISVTEEGFIETSTTEEVTEQETEELTTEVTEQETEELTEEITEQETEELTTEVTE